MNKSINSEKIKEVMNIIDEIADSKSKEIIAVLESRLRDITGKQELCAEDCYEYWGWISLEELAKTFLMPTPQRKGLPDKQLSEIIRKICECQYSESEMDYQLKLLEAETGLLNVADYIFYPDEVGLNMNAEVSEIIDKILEDRKK